MSFKKYRVLLCAVYTTTFPGAQVFHMLLHFPVVDHEHKIDSGRSHDKQRGQQNDSWLKEILKVTSAAVIIAILLADEVLEDRSLQSIPSLLND